MCWPGKRDWPPWSPHYMDPILIGCEQSQIICQAFRHAGYEAYSCDLIPTAGNPDWHIIGDVMEVIPTRKWSFILTHPDCTAMAVAGNKTYGPGKPKHDERHKAIDWTVKLWDLSVQHSLYTALENPVSVIFQHLQARGADTTYVQPYEHGHNERKKTGFAIRNLPRLQPTQIVEDYDSRKLQTAHADWRKAFRSITFPGIALALVEQWGPLIARDPKESTVLGVWSDRNIQQRLEALKNSRPIDA